MKSKAILKWIKEKEEDMLWKKIRKEQDNKNEIQTFNCLWCSHKNSIHGAEIEKIPATADSLERSVYTCIWCKCRTEIS